MVDADSHLKLLTTLIFNMYKVVEHIDMKLPPRSGSSSLAAVWWRAAMAEAAVAVAAAWQ